MSDNEDGSIIDENGSTPNNIISSDVSGNFNNRSGRVTPPPPPRNTDDAVTECPKCPAKPKDMDPKAPPSYTFQLETPPQPPPQPPEPQQEIKHEPFQKFKTTPQNFVEYQYDDEKNFKKYYGKRLQEAEQHENELEDENDKVYDQSIALSTSVIEYVMKRDKEVSDERIARGKALSGDQTPLDRYFSKPTRQGVMKGDAPPPLTSFYSSNEYNIEKTEYINSADFNSRIADGSGSSYDVTYSTDPKYRIYLPELPDEFIHIPKKVYEVPKYEEKPSNRRRSEVFFLWLHPSSFKIKMIVAIIISLVFILIFILFGWVMIMYLKDKSSIQASVVQISPPKINAK